MGKIKKYLTDLRRVIKVVEKIFSTLYNLYIMITQTKLHNLLNYDKHTGIFTWKESRGGIKAGTIAGSLCKDQGYITIQINGTLYRAHRLAVLYEYDITLEPGEEVDHINRIRNDNRIDNLQIVTHSDNQKNKSTNIAKQTGITYIRYRSKCIRPFVQLGKTFNEKWLGYFDTVEEAVQATRLALQELKADKELLRLEREYKNYLTKNS
jgi:hypothetical protein